MRVMIGIAIFLGAIILLIGFLIMYHRLKLRLEKQKIVPNGRLVKVDGNQIHVYTEGDNEQAPVILFLSGVTPIAPVYDFKPVWSKLSKEYRIAVVERIGYGYSDVDVTAARDIDTLLSNTRTALALADIKGPYVLCVHSLAGLESLHFAQVAKEEVAGIVGIDMLLPKLYLESGKELIKPLEQAREIRGLFRLGLQRLPLSIENLKLSPLKFTKEEQSQAKYLILRNLFNDVIFNEIDQLESNANVVAAGGVVDVPMKLLVANKQHTPELSKDWVQAHEEFAKEHQAQIKIFDSGHMLYQEKPEEVAAEIRDFVKGLEVK